MKPEFDSPNRGEIAVLADMHHACLPASVLSILGRPFLRSFYRFVADSPHEQVVVGRLHDRPVAGALISYQPESLTRRLLFTSSLSFAALTHLHRRAVRRAIFGRAELSLDDAAGLGALQASGVPRPELIILFTGAEARGKGVGGALVRHVDEQVAAAGELRYFVRTVPGDENPALRFYIGCGFERIGRLVDHGDEFSLLMKSLDTGG